MFMDSLLSPLPLYSCVIYAGGTCDHVPLSLSLSLSPELHFCGVFATSPASDNQDSNYSSPGPWPLPPTRLRLYSYPLSYLPQFRLQIPQSYQIPSGRSIDLRPILLGWAHIPFSSCFPLNHLCHYPSLLSFSSSSPELSSPIDGRCGVMARFHPPSFFFFFLLLLLLPLQLRPCLPSLFCCCSLFLVSSLSSCTSVSPPLALSICRSFAVGFFFMFAISTVGWVWPFWWVGLNWLIL